MFVCPHCQFENPTQNRFCQRCGNALRGLQAVISAVTAPATAPITQLEGAAAAQSSSESPAEVVLKGAPVTVSQLLTADQRFKAEQRYQLRQPQDAEQPLVSPMVLSILDCEPAADAPLAQQLAAIAENPDGVASNQILPAAALPYWKLQEHFFPIVPELQAAWQSDGYTVVVLEDRAAWPALDDLLASDEVEALELIHWFYEIINLWEALAAFKAEPSLLNQENLCIDEDQVLCIRRLMFDTRDRAYALKDLGLFWQSIFKQFPEHCNVGFKNLVADIAAGTVANPTTVKELLANIADNLQEADALATLQLINSADVKDGKSVSSISTNVGEKLMLAVDDPLLSEELAAFADTDEMDSEALEEIINDLPTMALPMKLYRLDEVGRTHVGRQRTHNEDSFFAETQLQRTDGPSGASLTARGLYILCDGMGGHSGGEVASALAVRTLKDFFAAHWHTDLPDESVIKEAILQANQAIFDKNEVEGRSGSARMGTTLVMVLIADNQAIVAHVGDSRLYSFSRQGLFQLTIDHEVGQREINRGVEPAIAYARPDAYQLTQALGPRKNDEVSPTVNTLHISQDTLLILCSDGLSDNDLLETNTESHLQPMLKSQYDLEEGVVNLIDLANERNGHDNITAIAVRVKMRPNLEAAQLLPNPADDTQPAESAES